MHEPECGRLAEVHKVKSATVASHIHSNDLLLLWCRPRTSFSVKLWKTSPGTGQNRTSRQPWSTYFLVLNFSFSLHSSSSSLVVWWPLIEPFLPFNIYVCSLCQVGCPEVCFSPPPFCHSLYSPLLCHWPVYLTVTIPSLCQGRATEGDIQKAPH